MNTVLEILKFRSTHAPDKKAYTYLKNGKLNEAVSITYSELYNRVKVISGALKSKGVKPGDTVLLMYPAGIDFIETFYSCLYLGCIPIPLYPVKNNYSIKRIVTIIKDSGAVFALSTESAIAIQQKIIKNNQDLDEVADLTWIATDCIENSQEPLEQGAENKEVAYLQYTSGSTAAPKGVIISHQNILHNVNMIIDTAKTNPDTVSVMWLPHFHDMGLISGIIQPLVSGYSVYLMSPSDFSLSPYNWLHNITVLKAGYSAVPNFALDLCVAKVDDEQLKTLDLSSLTVLFNGAEPIRAASITQFYDKFHAVGLRESVVSPAYGLAEATLKVTSHDPCRPAVIATFDKQQLAKNKAVPVASGDDSAIRLVGCGKIQASDMDVAIVDPVTKEELVNGSVGEIWTSGLSVSQGYWKNKDATDAVFNHRLKNKNKSYLRTGDLGFILDNELFISGRIKDVIILKGQNFFPQDIENSVLGAGIEALEGCRGALFSIQKDGVEEVILVHEISRAAMRLDDRYKQETVSRLVKQIAHEFDFMLAEVVLIPFSSLPTTSSGKISRSSAKEQYLDHSLKVIYAWNQKNDTISNIVKDILNLEQVDADASFFELGLSSIQAMQIAAMASESLGKSIELIDIFKSGSIKKLSQNVGTQVEDFRFIEPLEAKDVYDVSSGQRRIWLEEQMLEGNYRKYNESVLFKLSGKTDVNLLHAAIHALCLHHEILGTGYNMVSGKLVQFTVPHFSFSLDVTDVSTQDTGQELLQYSKRILEPAFDLQHGKVIRAGVLRVSVDQCFLVIGIHHIASDGWSKDIFINDLSLLYNGLLQGVPVTLPEPVIRYKDYAHWQLQSVSASGSSVSHAYWLSRFKDDIPVLELPIQGLRTEINQYEGGLVPVVFDAELTLALRGLAKQHQATLFTILLTFFKTLLYRYTGQSDLVVGTPVSGREHEDTENIIGFFLNSLALRTELLPSLSFGENVAHVKATLLAAYEHQHYPFDKLVGELDVVRDHTRNPLFDVMLVLQSNTARLSFEGVESTEIPNPCPVSKLDITFDLIEDGDQIRGSLVYKTQLFSQDFIEQFGASYQALIRSVIAHPEQSIAQLAMLSTEEKEFLDRFNATTSSYPSDESLASLFESQVALHADKTALQWHGGQMSYRELSAKTEQLAGLLSAYYEQGCSKQVGVCMSRSPEMVWALVAIIRSGGAYVPIDPHYPALRIEHILRDAEADLVLTTTEHLSLLEASQVQKIINLQEELPDKCSAILPPSVDDLAYILYTSGSTGNPKGAMLHHAGVVNRLHWQWHYCGYSEADIVLQKTPFTFDVSVWEFFLPLCYGATLALARSEKVLSPEDLLSDIATFKVSNLHFVPTMYNVFLESVHQNKTYDLSSLRCIINSGEALAAATGRYSYEQLPDVELYNLYGPTEASIDVSAYKVQAEDSKIPIGHPIANTKLYVLSDQLQPVPVGVHGEICISGIGLASGYRNLSEQTRQSFVSNPHEREVPYNRLYKTGDIGYWTREGHLMYVSRKDSQVKLRGFRIELGEIETALRGLEGVSDAVVITNTVSGTTVLIAYVISIRDITIGNLRQELSSRLPEYMLPSYVVRLAAFPLSQSGKLSRKHLPLPEESPVGEKRSESAQSETGKAIAASWSKTLNREAVGIYDDFFSIGGDSIKAMQVVGDLAQKGWKLSLKDLMNHPTIHDLEEKLSRTDTEESHVADPASLYEPFPLTDIQMSYFIGRGNSFELGGTSTVNYVEIETAFDIDRLTQSLNSVIEKHPMLRTIFTENGTQRVLKEVPFYNIEQIDLSNGSDEKRKDVILEHRHRATQHNFDIFNWPLFDFKAFKLDDTTHCLSVHYDVMMTDASSAYLWFDDLIHHYNQAPDAIPASEFSFRDYMMVLSNQKKGADYRKAKHYWQSKLEDFPFSPALPLLKDPASIGIPEFLLKEDLLTRDEWAVVKAIAKDKKMMPSAILATLFAEVLAYWSGAEHFAINLTVSERQLVNSNIPYIIGEFTSNLLLEIDLRSQKNYWDKANSVQANLLDALEHRKYSGVEVIQDLIKYHNSFGKAIMPVVFTAILNTDSDVEHRFPELGKQVYIHSRTPQVIIDFQAIEKEGELHIVLGYVKQLFDEQIIANVFHHLVTNIKTFVHTKKSAPVVLPEKDAKLWQSYNHTAEHIEETTLCHLLHHQVARTPDHVAVSSGSRQVSYKELHALSNAIANELRAKGITKNNKVGVIGHRNISTILNILGVIKSGAAYVPIDPEYPAERKEQIMQNSNCVVLLDTVSDGDFSVSSYQETELISLPDDVAYNIYTSGSTGVPKGVVISHKAVCNTILDINKRFNVNEKDRVLGISSLGFDLSVYDIFGTLSTGATLVIVPDQRDVENLMRLTVENRITVWNSVPAVMRAMLEAQKDHNEKWSHLRLIMWSGDWIPLSLPEKAKKVFPEAALVSLGGATEASIWSIYYNIHDVNKAWKSIPYGYPLANQQFYILDNRLNLCPVGVEGELFIGGVGVAEEYCNQPEQTAASYLVHPEYGRVYKTGDYGRMLSEGYIEFLGRKDTQVKIRGFRIELAEIEKAIFKTGIQQDVLALISDINGEKEIVVYVSGTETKDPGTLRAELVEWLPYYMIPKYMVFIDQFPLTSNGKVDRKKLPVPQATWETREFVQPETTTEKELYGICCEILKIDQFSMSQNLFDLGANSILATQIASRSSKKFKTEVRLADIFRNSSPLFLAKFIGEQTSKAYKQIPRIAERADYVTSNGQKRIWIEEQLLEGSYRKYNEGRVFRLRGEFHTGFFQIALGKVIQRYEVLRTSYAFHDGDVVQRISPDAFFEFSEKTTIGAASQDNVILESCREVFFKKFEIGKGEMLRVRVNQVAEHEFILIICVHHISSDGWSTNIMMNECGQFYNGLLQGESVSLPDPVIQYKDYAHWQIESLRNLSSSSRAYWLSRFKDDIPVLELPIQGLRTEINQYEGGLVPVVFDAELTLALRGLAKQHQATLFTILLTFFKTLLYRYTGQSDLVVGTPVSGREHEDTENIIGFFLNSLALRTELLPSLSFGENVAHVKATLLAAYEHQHYPFDKLVGELDVVRDHTRNPLFDVMLVLQSNTARLSFEGVESTEIPNPCPVSKLDITFDLIEDGDQIRGSLVYKTQLFSQDFIEQFGASYQALIRSVIAHPEQSIAQLAMLSTEEKEFLDRFNATTSSYPSDESLASLFESQVALHADKTALQWHGGQMSYRELSAKTEQLAGLLSAYYEQGCSKQVGVCMSRSPEMVWALVAIIRSGGAYVPIDPHYPALRIEHILRDAEADLVLTTTEHLSLLEASQVQKIINLQEELPDKCSAILPPSVDDLAYILYTSGSTGNPKGAMLHHAGVVNRLHWQWHYCGYSEADIVLQKTPFTFDVSVWEFFLPLCYGATLALARSEKVLSPEDLLSDIATFKVSNLHFVPTMYNVFLESVHQNKTYDLSSLRCIINSGEALAAATGRYSYEQLPDVELYNLYGPTEASIDVSAYKVQAEDSKIPIGHPIANTKLYVLSDQLQPVPVGVHGEICISGIGLASGYRNLSEQTRQSFVSNPHEREVPYNRLYKTGDIGYWTREGHLMYVSRKDSQVKLRGFRIELGEIETALRGLEGVSDAVVITNTVSGTTVLIAYVISIRDITIGNLRQELSSRLPEYMLPSYVVRLAAFPLSQSGKLSRKHLPLPEESPVGEKRSESAQSETGKAIAASWSKTLNREAVGIYDDFFSIGGDSIKAMQVVGDLAQKGWKLSLKDLMNHPTIHDLEEKISRTDTESAVKESRQNSGLSPIEHWFFEQQFDQEHFWNQGVLLTKEEGFDLVKVEEAFRIICQQHEQLRARFVKSSGKMKRVISDTVDHCFSIEQVAEEGSAAGHGSPGLEAWQGKGHLETGPLIKILAVKSEHKTGRLWISIHHLLIDGISWRILLEDFERTYNDLLHNRVPVFVRTIEFSEWVNSLEDYAEQHFSEQIRFWQHQLAALETSLPEKHKNSRYKTKDHVTYTHTIKGRKLQHALEILQNKGFATHEVLLSSLANSYALKTAEPALFWVEGHGRFDCGKDIDLSKTIGWFTSLYPVLIQNDDSILTLQKVQRQLRNIPDQGQGYLWLKNSLNAFGETTDMAVCFNYLGDLSESDFSFNVERLPVDAVVSKQSHRPFKLEVVAFKQQQDLVVEFYFAEEYLPAATVKEMAFHVEALFEETVATLEKNGLQSWYASQPVSVPLVPDLSNAYQPYPLTDIQMSYLIGRESGFELGGVSTVNYLEIDTLLDIDKLSASLNELIAKHPMLRTVIHANGTQQILPQVPVYTIGKTDLRGIPEHERTAILNEKRSRGIEKNFAPDVWPLFEFTAYRISDSTHRLLINYDLMIIDAGSSFILFEDLLNHYRGNPYLIPETDFTFRDYLMSSHQLETQQAYLRDKAYWQNKVEDFPGAPVLPVMEDLSAIENPVFEIKQQTIDAKIWQEFKKQAKKTRTTPSALLMTVFSEILGFWSNSSRFSLNLSVNERQMIHPDVEYLVGEFTSTILLDIDFRACRDFWQKAGKVQESLFEALEHKSYNGVKFIQDLSLHHKTSGKAMMPIVFTSVLNSNRHNGVIESLGTQNFIHTKTSQVMMDFQVIERGETLQLVFGYVSQLFKKEMIDHIFENFTGNVHRIATTGDAKPVAGLERHLHLWESYNHSQVPIPETNLLDLFMLSVKQFSAKTAIECEDECISYSALNTEANRVASYLHQQHVRKGDLVAVSGNREIGTIINIFGILKAGAAYVPVDPEYPEKRKKQILESCHHKQILGPELYRNTGNVGEPSEIVPDIQPGDVAYVIFTSGSTGNPKGVVIQHGAAANTILDMNARFSVTSNDKVLGISSLGFDLSVYDIFGTFASGGTLVLLKDQRDTVEISEKIIKHGITVWNSVPAIMNVSYEEIRRREFMQKKLYWNQAVSWRLENQQLLIDEKVYGEYEKQLFPDFYFYMTKGSSIDELFERFSAVDRAELKKFTDKLIEQEVLGAQAQSFRKEIQRYVRLYDTFDKRIRYEESAYRSFKTRKLNRSNEKNTGQELMLDNRGLDHGILGKRRSVRVYDKSTSVAGDLLKKAVERAFTELRHQVHALELCVYIKDKRVSGLRKGVYRYSPANNRYNQISVESLSPDCFSDFNKPIVDSSAFVFFFSSNGAHESNGPEELYQAGLLSAKLMWHLRDAGLGSCYIGDFSSKHVDQALRHLQGQRTMIACVGGIEDKHDNAEQNYDLKIGVNDVPDAAAATVSGEKALYYWSTRAGWEIKDGAVFVNGKACPLLSPAGMTQVYFNCQNGCSESELLEACHADRSVFDFLVEQNVLVRDVSLNGLVRSEHQHPQAHHAKAIDFLTFSALLSCFSQDRSGETINYKYPSGGGLYPIDLYFKIGKNAVKGLREGLYYFNPARNSISYCAALLSSADDSFVEMYYVYDASVNIPRYGATGVEFSLIEAGIMNATLLVAADALGIGLGNLSFNCQEHALPLTRDQALIGSVIIHPEKIPHEELKVSAPVKRRSSDLRLVLLSGDWIPLELPAKINTVFPDAAVYSLGGATEASIWSIYYPITEMDVKWKSIPYGMPLGNQTIYVLGHHKQPCAPGVEGDIYIGGRGLAKEYLGDAEKTNAAFINHPDYGRLYLTGDMGIFHEEGYVEFRGRKDTQAKVRGFRIELGEILYHLTNHPLVEGALVELIDDAKAEKEICAYVISRTPDETGLRKDLSSALPYYMVPKYIVFMKEFPLTANGKIDKHKLAKPELKAVDANYVKPANAQEELLERTICEVMKLERLSIDTNFFEIGCSSIQLMKIYQELNRYYPQKLRIVDFFTNTSIRSLSNLIGYSEQTETSEYIEIEI